MSIVEKQGTPLFVYDSSVVTRSATKLRTAITSKLTPVTAGVRCFFAIKANSNRELIALALKAGFGLECVSRYEVEYAAQILRDATGDMDADRILFTPNFAPRSEYEYVLNNFPKAHVTIDNIYPLQHWPDLLRGRQVFLRLDPGQGYGHHKKVMTAGIGSKFGISAHDIEKAAELAKACGCTVVGLHAHVGSGILDAPGPWPQTLHFLAEQALKFGGTVKHLDIGGGYGVVYDPRPESDKKTELNLDLVAEAIAKVAAEMKLKEKGIELWTEPGRYVIAQAGVLLAKVTQSKLKPGAKPGESSAAYVGVDVGMNTLIRPALYESYHHIESLNRFADPLSNEEVQVVGPICETGDVLNGHVKLPTTTVEGDVLAICTAGAYGRSMSSFYNLRAPAAEVILP